jgi:hypothetical protein
LLEPLQPDRAVVGPDHEWWTTGVELAAKFILAP